MKGRVTKQKCLTSNFERKSFMDRTGIPKKLTPIIEVIAKAWIMCDPNRQPLDPDAPSERGNSKPDQKEWHWFIPRAEETLKYLDRNGYKVVKK